MTIKAKKKNTKKKVAASLAVLLAAASALTLTSLAVFTDQETVTNNAFTTGTLDLTVGTNSALLTATAMIPGDQVTSPLVVGNGGSIPLRYAMTTAMTPASDAGLSAELVLVVKSGVTTCTNAGFGADGTEIFNGALNTGFVGDPTQGADAGDRALAVAANESLCFNVALPLSSTAQGVTAEAAFTFDAEQTPNNP